ncbi:hypothetical protein SDRG_15413 [Saprolegnia diclina VS20]|uniref:Protein kinase domain-containing protein n=1 Tax=Saprolegnia diclina (strain VS20) TaxID=1156394 RepID=T0R3Z3_SAPDV|nr:hypothetical protein SDRG_15413 [Saprolegnia diclina VS20]EQC26763.1 hypothetical protein SDRG_15413 [Saprolegnia diclina VS20]|eukprot:XP_008619806.1 hypothetical protein SDRG_15413 [Saprolegnia diclina VS20]
MEYDGSLLLMLPSFRRCLEDDALHAMETAYGMRRPDPVAHAPTAPTTTTSKHLARYTSWKLDPTKIDALVQAETKGVAALARVTSTHCEPDGRAMELEFYASGKRGMLFVNKLRTALVKVQKLDGHGIEVIEKETKWLRIVNRISMGPRLLGAGDGYFMCEFLADGVDAVAFLQAPSTSRGDALWFLRSVLYQCYALDRLGINKAEMSHPMRHIIVVGARVVFVDFEKCTYGRQRRNVTQVCQFLSSPRIVAAVMAKGHSFALDKVRAATKAYKANPHSATLAAILHALHLA